MCLLRLYMYMNMSCAFRLITFTRYHTHTHTHTRIHFQQRVSTSGGDSEDLRSRLVDAQTKLGERAKEITTHLGTITELVHVYTHYTGVVLHLYIVLYVTYSGTLLIQIPEM